MPSKPRPDYGPNMELFDPGESVAVQVVLPLNRQGKVGLAVRVICLVEMSDGKVGVPAVISFSETGARRYSSSDSEAFYGMEGPAHVVSSYRPPLDGFGVPSPKSKSTRGKGINRYIFLFCSEDELVAWRVMEVEADKLPETLDIRDFAQLKLIDGRYQSIIDSFTDPSAAQFPRDVPGYARFHKDGK